jgi:hypothetical protein
MKTKSIVFISLLTAASAHAATGIFGSHVEVFTTTATIYKGENYGTASNFEGANLGTFNLSDTLIFGQAQINTFKDPNAGEDVTGGEMQYRVYKTTSTPGSFSTQTFGFQQNIPFTDIAGNSANGFGDQLWGNTNDIDLLALATEGNGDYTIEIFFKASTSLGDRFSNNGGNNFKATFTVVPEPSTALLGALGTLALMRRRRA